MPIPEYEDLARELLRFIYLKGGPQYAMRPRDVYEPLADRFHLSRVERDEPRPDGGPGTHWQNRCQWTRQRLVNHGMLAPSTRGVWKLTKAGISKAKESRG